MTLTTVDAGMLNSQSQQTWRNRLINGAMVIDQRNAGASISVGSSPVYPVDRFQARIAQGSGHTAQRSTTAPAGFINSVLITVGTGASPTSGQVSIFNQQIEGFNVADLGWGAAGAQPVTISFKVRSSVTGTFTVSVSNSGLDRSYVTTYTISAANTFEDKQVTIPGDTSGTWLKDNGVGAFVFFDLGSGSDRQATADSWGAGWKTRTSGSVTLAATSGATFYITGVQLEKGSTATAFDYRPYGTELALCQRYFFNIVSGNAKTVGMGSYETATRIGTVVYLPVTMRAVPTLVQVTGTDYYYIYRSSAYDGFSSFTLGNATTNILYLANSSDVSGTAGQSGYIATDNASASLSVSSEL